MLALLKEKSPNEPLKVARVSLGAHLGPRDEASRGLAEPWLAHAKSNAGLRARASGGASVGNLRCARMASITLLSEMSATIVRRPPQGQAKTSTKWMRRRSDAHSSLEPTGFTTPSPRLVRGQ